MLWCEYQAPYYKFKSEVCLILFVYIISIKIIKSIKSIKNSKSFKTNTVVSIKGTFVF